MRKTRVDVKNRKFFLGVFVDPVSPEEVTEFIIGAVRGEGPPVWVGNLNVHAVNLAVGSAQNKELFNRAELNFCDGRGLAMCLRAVGLGFVPQVTYNQWLPDFMTAAHVNSIKVYILGDEPEVISAAADLANTRYPGVVVGHHHGYFRKEENGIEELSVVEDIRRSGADIVIVGMGMPIQEQFIVRNLDAMNVKVALNGGACFKFFVGQKRIAPRWVAWSGMEWLFRLLLEPRRLAKRYLIGNPLFVWRLLWWRITTPGQGQ